MTKIKKTSFVGFLARFPEIELPVTLTEESHHDFGRTNDPLTADMIAQYITPLEIEPADEFTEYIPCFRIPNTYDFHAIVFWKAGLMTYEYVMVTYTKKGISINKRIIAGTKTDGEQLLRTVATIEEDWIIYCVRGVAPANDPSYDPTTSESLHLELLASGEIILSE